ncbi:glycosyltransferase family 4 protein [Sphingobacterium faecale]|uniref:Glycosyltransferase family 4 protein n=1 Tax=Sphingobacterium faecale TaxID=2803775 RepID=A0ABS1QZP5_9SPHI|nr:glycosyltransferase family 4 protein [Sphingobacterium faecale]MBL1407789.1 glycosyltransferase family 4 protein [Sphingobacterium faecale]
MRILIIHNFYQHKGGEDVVFAQETAILKEGNHQVETISFHNRKGIKGLIQFFLYPWNIITARRIMKMVRKFKPDVVHIHNTHYAIGPLIFRKLQQAKIPVVLTLHNFRLLDPSANLFHNNAVFTDTIDQEFPWKSIKNKVLDNSLLKTFWTAFTVYLHKKLGTWSNIEQILTFSEFGKQLFLRSTIQFKEQQIAIKPNFTLETSGHTAIERKDYFVYIGRLSEEKGIRSLLDAFAQCNHTIRIFGDGPLAEQVKQAAQSSSNIVYGGFQNQEALHKYLSESQALIIPSIWFEGMPMTVLEAFACGTPVIASRIGILEEMVDEGENGFLFEPNNAKSMKNTLDTWQNLTLDKKKTISEKCKKDFSDKYSSQKNVLLLERIYQKAIQLSKNK